MSQNAELSRDNIPKELQAYELWEAEQERLLQEEAEELYSLMLFESQLALEQVHA